MMDRRINSILSAGVTLLVFTILPLYASRIMPPTYLEMALQYGIDISSFMTQIATIGVVIALLTMVKGFVEPSSPVYLLVSLASSAITFAFTLIAISLGRFDKIANLGLTSIDVDVQGSVNHIVMDFRIFVQLSAIAVFLKMIETILTFMETRREKDITQTRPLAMITELDSPSVVARTIKKGSKGK
jgi:hypothetical protein